MVIDPKIDTLLPAQRSQHLFERCKRSDILGSLSDRNNDAESTGPVRLLRMRRKWLGSRNTAKNGDKVASSHGSIYPKIK